MDATLASPLFALNDYGFTPFATAPGNFPNPPIRIQGPGGVLSQNDAGNQLQLEDATMRAQFNKTGSSSYHLRLNPVVHDAITIVVPNGQGTVLQSVRGVHFGDVNLQWWRTRIQNWSKPRLRRSDAPPIYLTKDVTYYSDSPESVQLVHSRFPRRGTRCRQHTSMDHQTATAISQYRRSLGPRTVAGFFRPARWLPLGASRHLYRQSRDRRVGG